MTAPFSMAVESGLSAHFKQPDGPSLPGTDWLVRIERDGRTHHARVRSLLQPSASKATRNDQAYQAQTTMQYLADQMEGGWDPANEREHLIHIGDPHGQASAATGVEATGDAAKPWWKFW